MKNPGSEYEAGAAMGRTCRDPATRRIALEIFAESIREANTHGRGCWTLNMGRGDALRLVVGHYYVCTLTESGVWLALDDCFLRPGAVHLPTREKLAAWGWAQDPVGQDGSYPTYKDTHQRDFSANGVYAIGPHHAEAWPHVRRLHFGLLYKAAHFGQPMDRESPALHCDGAVKAIRAAIGAALPDPLHAAVQR